MAVLHRMPILQPIGDLPSRFNASRGQARLVVILSPTYGTSLSGARIVKKDVLDNLLGEPLRTFVIWTPLRADDTRDAAQQATQLLDTIEVEQFWDPNRSIARQYGKVVDLPSNRTLAWNSYFVHGRADEWHDRPPVPASWMHQLGRDNRTLDGSTLLDLVTKEIKKPRPGTTTSKRRGG